MEIEIFLEIIFPLNAHIVPILFYRFCTPCGVRLTHILKIETLERDSNYILKKAMGVNAVIPKLEKKNLSPAFGNRKNNGYFVGIKKDATDGRSNGDGVSTGEGDSGWKWVEHQEDADGGDDGGRGGGKWIEVGRSGQFESDTETVTRKLLKTLGSDVYEKIVAMFQIDFDMFGYTIIPYEDL